ncbi:MAG: hypothetical protein ACRCXZ_04890, partial [Patescibacteria group bacterium]
FIAKLCFISGFSFYISNVIGLILTAQTTISIYLFPNIFNEEIPFYFILLVISNILMQLLYVYKRPNFGTILAHATASWAYIFTILSLLLGHKEGWTPTGQKSSVSGGFLTQYLMLSIYLLVALASLAFIINTPAVSLSKIGLLPLFFWAVVNIFYHFSAWTYWSEYLKSRYLVTRISLVPNILFNLQKIAIVFLFVTIVVSAADSLSNRGISARIFKQKQGNTQAVNIQLKQ